MATQTDRNQYVQVSQVNARYWTAGEVGSAVLLLHGLGSFVEHWEHSIDVLAERHRVYAVDMVGFGRSGKPDVAYSVSLLAQFVIDFMATQGLASACLVGNSMGGAVALEMAARFPMQVDRLVLVDGVGLGGPIPTPFRLAALPVVGELVQVVPTRWVVAEALRLMLHDPALITDDLFATACEISELPGLKRSFLRMLRAMARDVAATDSLAAAAFPTLIVWGEQDRVLPVSYAHAAAQALRRAELCILDPCGHMPQLERPEEFNAAVVAFLAG